LFIAYVVSGDTTHAKSTEIGWFSRRLQTTVLPELRKAHVPNTALARLQSPLPQVRATGVHLPRLRRADCAHHESRRQSSELIALKWPRRAVRRREEEDLGSATDRRFPAQRKVEETTACFIVRKRWLMFTSRKTPRWSTAKLLLVTSPAHRRQHRKHNTKLIPQWGRH